MSDDNFKSAKQLVTLLCPECDHLTSYSHMLEGYECENTVCKKYKHKFIIPACDKTLIKYVRKGE